jgi:hypothetical protein
MITLTCDRCEEKWLGILPLDTFFDWENRKIILPLGWTERKGNLFCPKHTPTAATP